MKKLKNKKVILIIMLIIMSIIIGMVTKIVLSATQGTVYEFTLPRGSRDEAWGHTEKTFMNGWTFDSSSRAFTVRSINGYENQTAYCIEPRS